MTYGGLKAQLK